MLGLSASEPKRSFKCAWFCTVVKITEDAWSSCSVWQQRLPLPPTVHEMFTRFSMDVSAVEDVE